MTRKSTIIACGLLMLVIMVGCAIPQPESSQSQDQGDPVPNADLAGIKSYLLDKAGELKTQTTTLKNASDAYYDLTNSVDFDYAGLWLNQPDSIMLTIMDARTAWMAASPIYEQIEGIVAGTPTLAEYDVILDAGASGDEDPENAVPFDLTLADGRILARPGNLFGVTEATLWGTFEPFGSGVEADWDSDGDIEFGETLPDAQVLKAAADTLDSYTEEMVSAANDWEPTESDAFTSLVVMVPTMSEYFNSWKNSRFILGEESTQRDFVVISRLSDIQNILGSLQIVYQGIQPLAESADTVQATQIEQGLAGLKSFVADVYDQEQNGEMFTPDDADVLGAEAQNLATAIAGQVAQIAAKLGITIQE